MILYKLLRKNYFPKKMEDNVIYVEWDKKWKMGIYSPLIEMYLRGYTFGNI